MASTILNSGPRVLLALAFTTICFYPSQYLPELEQLAAYRIEPTASFASKLDPLQWVSLMTAQEMIADLRRAGMPVSAIADAMRVERKTIYAWLNGGDVRTANVQRAAQIHTLLSGTADVDVHGVYRFWHTALLGKHTLRDLIAAENIDELKVRSVLNQLRPAALRATASEKKMTRQGTTNAILDEIPEAGINR